MFLGVGWIDTCRLCEKEQDIELIIQVQAIKPFYMLQCSFGKYITGHAMYHQVYFNEYLYFYMYLNSEDSPVNSAVVVIIVFHQYEQIISYDRTKLKITIYVTTKVWVIYY